MVTAWLNIRFCPRKPVLTEWVRVLTSSCSIFGAATTGLRTGRKWLPLTPATVECIYKRNNKRRQVFSFLENVSVFIVYNSFTLILICWLKCTIWRPYIDHVHV